VKLGVRVRRCDQKESEKRKKAGEPECFPAFFTIKKTRQLIKTLFFRGKKVLCK
jgi:hypothetical protein